MYRGTGQPQLISDDIAESKITLPMPLKNRRKETFKDEKKVYTSINGTQLPQPSRFRFNAEYEFGVIDTLTLDAVVRIYNKQSICKLVPHSDFPFISFHVVIKDVTLPPFNGNIKRDSLKLKVESVDYVYKIPTIDNMIAGMLLTRVGVIQQELVNN